MFSTGFIQKTIKGDLFVEANYGIPPRKQRGKILEDSRRLSTEVDPEGLPCGVDRPHPYAARPVGSTDQPPLRKSVPHCLLYCIYAILSSRFDPRVQN